MQEAEEDPAPLSVDWVEQEGAALEHFTIPQTQFLAQLTPAVAVAVLAIWDLLLGRLVDLGSLLYLIQTQMH